MGAFEYIMIYIISWWVLLFMVLPFRVKQPSQLLATAYAAAPEKTYLKQKLIATSLLAGVATALLAWLFHNEKVITWLAGS